MNDIMERVSMLLKENVESLHDIEILPQTSLISSGYLDSFEIINFIAVLEAEFNFKIELENVNFSDFETPDSISKLIAAS